MDFDELMKDLQNEAKEAEKRAKTQEEVEALLVSARAKRRTGCLRGGSTGPPLRSGSRPGIRGVPRSSRVTLLAGCAAPRLRCPHPAGRLEARHGNYFSRLLAHTLAPPEAR